MSMKFNHKSLALLLVDSLFVNLAALGSFYLCFEGDFSKEYFRMYLHTAWAGTIICLLIFTLFGLYNRLWQYASINELIAIFFAVTAGTISVLLVEYFLAPIHYPNIVAVLFWFIAIFLIGGARFIGRVLHDTVFNVRIPGIPKRILIIGAGDAGAIGIRELKNSNYREGYPIGIIDDDPDKQKLKLMGIPVLGTRKDITRVVKAYKVEEVIIAMPSVSVDVIRDITEICEKCGVVIKSIPGIYNYVSKQVDTLKIRQRQVENLLGKVQEDEFRNRHGLTGIMN
jgi:FlaA1/EpsC-like NDP-sugar epimerase